MKKVYESLEWIGLIVCGGIAVIVHRIYPDRPLLYALLLLPGLILLAIASFIHMRLPKEEQEPVRMVWFDTRHLYLTFLTVALLELFLFIQLLQEEGNHKIAGILGTGGIIILLVSEIASYVVYYKQQKSNKPRRAHRKKKRK